MLAWVRRRFHRRKGTGYTPDPVDERDKRLGAVMMTAELDRQPGKERRLPVPWIADQGPTNRCVGFAVALAISIRERMTLGDVPRRPSVNHLYWNARQPYAYELQVPVSDDGTFIRDCVSQLRALGVSNESDWPSIERTINRAPGISPQFSALPRQHGSYYRIATLRETVAALDAGLPVVFGTAIGESFWSMDGPEVLDVSPPGDPYAGGHAMVCVGYRVTLTGAYQMRIANSWGTRWRDGGCTWVSEAWWRRCRDRWAIDGWDSIRSAA